MKRILFQIFVLILIFSPLAFGSVEPWSLGIMETLSFSALFILLLTKIRDKNARLYEIPGIIPLLILAGYILFQLVPMPSEVIKVISPGTYNIYRDTVLVIDPHALVSISVNKKATFAEFLRITSYLSFYVLTVQLLKDRDILKKTVASVVIFVSVLSFFSMLQHILWNNKIFWFRELTLGGTPFGPYVNRNHYAGFMGMVFPVVLSLFLFYKPRVPYKKSFREHIIKLFNITDTNIYLLLGLSVVLIATSIFLTLSRTGIVSLCISMIIFGLMFITRGVDRKRGIVIVTASVLIVLSVGWFGWEPVIERFSKIKGIHENIFEERLVYWRDSENIIKSYPLTGTGFGTFVDIYPAFRTSYNTLTLEHAHNDYIELLTDGGILAVIILSWFLCVLFYKSFKTFLKRRDIYSIYLFIGSITGMISILIHSVTDFNLHIGANGLYFFFLSGLAVSAAHTRLQDARNDTYLKNTWVPAKTFAVPLAAVVIASFIFNSGVVIGNSYFSSIKGEKLNDKKSSENLLTIRDAAYRASFFDPLEAQYHFVIANTEKSLSHNDIALNQYMKAVKSDPLNGEYLQGLGLAMSELKNYSAADRLLHAGIKYDVTNPSVYKRYALWFIIRGKKEDGLSIMERAISLEPGKTRDYVTLMVLAGLNDDDILRSLPERVEPHLLFADYLFKTGKKDMAEEEYHNALGYLHDEKQIKRSYFYQAYGYYMKTDRYQDALKVMQKAMDYFHDDVDMILKTADLCERLGMNDDAVRQYKRALVIRPENMGAKKKLDALLLKMKGA